MSETIWRALSEKALGGASIDTLGRETADGLRIEPLYGRHRGGAPRAMRQRAGPWSIAQRVDHPDPAEANRLALLDLEGGANALTLVFGGESARGFGLPNGEAALATALEGIELDYIALRLDAGMATIEAVTALAGVTTARRMTSAALAVDLGFDPIGCRARLGHAMPGDLCGEALRAFLASSTAAGLSGCTFMADGRPYHEAGAGEAQELAAVLATGVAYLRRLESAGYSAAEAAAAIAFLLAADAETFLTIAKFRALRRLWARIETACGLIPRPIRLHAETAWRMMSRNDPWMNVMRATGAVAAAGLGGADMVTALPFTLALGLAEDGARRLVRNTQLVLLDEAHLAKVEDPAAGSGGLEALTDALCVTAWGLFQAIEREGGIEASLRDGAIQARVADVAARRARDFATMARAIVGTSTYPVLSEAPPLLAKAERRPEPPRGRLGLPTARDAHPFEALRDRAEAAAVAGQRPRVFLATIGEPTAYGSHAAYAANVFAAGGIQSVTGAIDEDLRGYDSTATPIACICASSALDTHHIDAAIQKLRAAGARWVLRAGAPNGSERPLPDTPVDGFIHPGCDVLLVLARVLDS